MNLTKSMFQFHLSIQSTLLFFLCFLNVFYNKKSLFSNRSTGLEAKQVWCFFIKKKQTCMNKRQKSFSPKELTVSQDPLRRHISFMISYLDRFCKLPALKIRPKISGFSLSGLMYESVEIQVSKYFLLELCASLSPYDC